MSARGLDARGYALALERLLDAERRRIRAIRYAAALALALAATLALVG